MGDGYDIDPYNILEAILYISSTGEITVIEKDVRDTDFCVENEIEKEYYIEYDGKGYYVPHFRSGGILWQPMYGVKDNKPYDTGISGHISLDEDGDLNYYNDCIGTDCKGIFGNSMGKNHKHILLYNEETGKFEIYVKSESGEVAKLYQ